MPASSLNNLAALYVDQGAYRKAEPLHLRALQIRESALGENHPAFANSLSNLAVLYQYQGAYQKAEPLFLRALQIRESTQGKNHPVVATSLSGLANLYVDQGAYQKAEPLHLRALQIRESALGKDHPVVAESLNYLANLYVDQGVYQKAEPLFLRALQIRESALGKDHPRVADSLNSLAILYQARGSSQQALPLFSRAFFIQEHTLRLVRLLTTESRLDSFLKKLQSDVDAAYSLPLELLHDPGALRLALATALLRKGRSLDEAALASREFFEIQSKPAGTQDRAAFDQLQSLRHRLAKSSLDGPGKLSAMQYQQLLADLEKEADEIEQNLANHFAPLRAQRQLPGPQEIIARVATALPRDGALVEIVAFAPVLFAATGQQPRHGAPHYLALVLLPDGQEGQVRVADLGQASVIDAAIQRLLPQLAVNPRRTPQQQDAYLPPAQELFRLVMKPLLPLLGPQQRLFLSPDGQLNLIPFAALHDGQRFLIDRFEVNYLTSGRDLLRQDQEQAPATSVVLLADPDFNAVLPVTGSAANATLFPDRGLTDGPAAKYQPLPGSRQEAEQLSKLLPGAKKLLGKTATKQALLGLTSPGILHVATHGVFLQDAAAASGGGRGPVLDSPNETGPRGPVPNPLLRSMLVLAGAGVTTRKPGSATESDGLATALEVAGMDLWGTQLVVLSACSSGKGEIQTGQGVYGLRRAVMVAGAETLVMSLWSVDDQVTRDLMVDYYKRLLMGSGRAEAMRQAARAVRETKAHPYYWAPFIVLGRADPLRGIGGNGQHVVPR